MANKTIGTAACKCCKVDVPVKESDKGAVSINCPWCNLQAWAPKGTQAARIIMKEMQPVSVDDDETGAAKQPVAEPEKTQESTPAKGGILGRRNRVG